MKYLRALLGVSFALQVLPALAAFFPQGDIVDAVHGLQKPALRLLPLGDSITYGTNSTHGNGYREALLDKLSGDGWEVDMIGSRQIGDMKDNDVEGWPGYVIDEIHEKAEQDYELKPNLVLVHAGTNDCLQQLDIDYAPGRMDSLIDDLFESIEDVTLVLGGLLVNKRQGACTRSVSEQYKWMVKARQEDGQKIIFADMHTLTVADLADRTHPNDEGYRKMAVIWSEAIQEAYNMWLITQPLDNGS